MSIDGAIKTISPARRGELGQQLAEETIKLRKLHLKQLHEAAGWRKTVNDQQEYVDELSMAIELGKEQVDQDGKFVKAPEGAANQLEIPGPAKRGRPAADEDEEGDGEEPAANSPEDIGFPKRRGRKPRGASASV